MPAGKETVEITAVKEVEDTSFFGNARHASRSTSSRAPWDRMTVSRLVPFLALADALARGYDGCALCIPTPTR